MVELAEAVCALLLAQQGIVGAHTGIVGLVVQGLSLIHISDKKQSLRRI